METLLKAITTLDSENKLLKWNLLLEEIYLTLALN